MNTIEQIFRIFSWKLQEYGKATRCFNRKQYYLSTLNSDNFAGKYTLQSWFCVGKFINKLLGLWISAKKIYIHSEGSSLIRWFHSSGIIAMNLEINTGSLDSLIRTNQEKQQWWSSRHSGGKLMHKFESRSSYTQTFSSASLKRH